MPPRRQRRRYTLLHVTVNTNFAANSAAVEQRVGDDLERFVRVTLGDINSWRRLIKIEPSFEAVETVKVDAIGIERGPKFHRMHLHMVVIIQHRGKVLWRYGQRQWQNLLREKLPYLRGPYVHIKLMNASALNYVSKQSADATQVRQLGIQSAVTF